MKLWLHICVCMSACIWLMVLEKCFVRVLGRRNEIHKWVYFQYCFHNSFQVLLLVLTPSTFFDFLWLRGFLLHILLRFLLFGFYIHFNRFYGFYIRLISLYILWGIEREGVGFYILKALIYLHNEGGGWQRNERKEKWFNTL